MGRRIKSFKEIAIASKVGKDLAVELNLLLSDNQAMAFVNGVIISCDASLEKFKSAMGDNTITEITSVDVISGCRVEVNYKYLDSRWYKDESLEGQSYWKQTEEFPFEGQVERETTEMIDYDELDSHGIIPKFLGE